MAPSITLSTSRNESASLLSTSAMSLDQQAADLVLLSQNLAKSKRITNQMTGILGGFDERLARLEHSVLGVYKSMGEGRRVGRNIDATLKSIENIVGQHDLVDSQRDIIKKGPNPNDIGPYTEAIDRLVTASKASNIDQETRSQMAKLVNQGAEKLGGAFTIWVTEWTGKAIDIAALRAQGTPFPTLSSSKQERWTALLTYLRSLPGGSTQVEKDIQNSFAEVRGNWMANSLQAYAEGAIDVARSGGKDGRLTLGGFLEVMFQMAKSELSLASSIFPSYAIKTIYAVLIPPTLAVLYQTGTQINTIVKRSITETVSVAFQSFSELQGRGEEFDEWIRGKSGRKDNELGELLHAFRGTCLRSLPEFIQETKEYGSKTPLPNEPVNPRVSGMTLNVVNFMKHVCEHQGAVESFLKTLGDGNWNPGGRAPRLGDDQTLTEKYLGDVLSTLLTSLEQRSKSMGGRKGMPAIFLLNNLSYVRREILSSQVSDVLNESIQDDLNKKMRGARAAYLDIWSPLVSALLDAGIEHGGAAGAIKAGLGVVGMGAGQREERREVKDRFGRFNDALDEVEALHRVAPLDRGESELKERLKVEVVKMVVPTYSKFAQKHMGGDFSKNPSKYFKLDGDQVKSHIEALFE